MKVYTRSICLSALGLALIFVTGCNQYGYRYAPNPQPWQDPVYADYRRGSQSVDILVDTRGRQLLHIQIVSADGHMIAPSKVDYPPIKAELMSGIKDDIYGPPRVQGPTVAHFDKQTIGPGPWNVSLKIEGLEPLTVNIGSKSI